MNFNHRLSGHDSKEPEPNTLVNAIDGMTSRARAQVSTLQSSFLGENNRVNDETAFHALESIYMELVDIQKVTFEFQQAQKSPAKEK